jgi:hypothetical protein
MFEAPRYDKTVTLSLDEQVVIQLAIRDRLRWLDRIGIPSDDAMVLKAKALLDRLADIPVTV